MQDTNLAFVRENISEAVATQLRAMIVDGRLPAGERINEVHLAMRLDISRTPLREALAGLAAEGALRSVPRIGYFVRPLTVEELEQVYALRPILDPVALRLAGIPPRERIERLDAINRALETAGDPETAMALDEEFHLLLLADCPNRFLVEMIEQVNLRTRRYDIALMRETRSVERATGDHDRIIAALRRGDLDAACAALKHNMESGRPVLVEWLKSREAKKETRTWAAARA